MIRADDLTKRYGAQTVLDGLDLEIERGERVAVLGVNGAGKTTLFRCLLGLTDFEGELTVDGAAAGPESREVRSRIGYVPQLPPIYDTTLEGFLELFAGLRDVDVQIAEARLEELGLPIEETAGKSMSELSGGMLQKAYLAMALAAETPVLLLDEPTASLDPGSRREFVRLLKQIDRRMTMVLASHRLEEIEPLADRLVVLHRGAIAFDGTLPQLWERAGLEQALWIGSPPSRRDDLLAILRDHPAVRAVHPNGVGVRIEAPGDAHLDVLHDVRTRGVPVPEFHTRPPALEDVLDHLVSADGSAAGAGAAERVEGDR
ncbi:MAG: ABC transporter ATP-binding protein [Gemmatimonadota bacterium]|nr:ABC transporter ATP-binding protein [Gemmatimonadota bacterium]